MTGVLIPCGSSMAIHYPPRVHTILDDSEQYLRAREAEAMCDHVWIFDGQRIRLWLRFRLP
jgi:hypothetical protein